jgi:hypothetical protein
VLAGGGTLFSLDLSRLHPVLGTLGVLREYLTFGLVFVFCALFPDGRFVPRRMRWVVLGASLLGLVGLFGDALLAWLDWPDALAVVPGLVVLAVLLKAQGYRSARVSDWRQRQQQKWVGTGFAVWLLVTAAMPILPQNSARGAGFDLIAQAILNGAAVLAPLSLAIAVLRYGLWEIDVLLSCCAQPRTRPRAPRKTWPFRWWPPAPSPRCSSPCERESRPGSIAC